MKRAMKKRRLSQDSKVKLSNCNNLLYLHLFNFNSINRLIIMFSIFINISDEKNKIRGEKDFPFL